MKIKKYLDEENKKWNIKDTITIIFIMFLYGIVSFYHLGDWKAPNTFISLKNKEEIVFELNKEEDITKIKSYNGLTPATYNLYYSLDGKKYDYIGRVEGKYCFTWNELFINEKAKYIKIESLKKANLGEIGFYNKKLIPIKKISTKKELIDEQVTIPEQISYMNSMYFDEIYFARTAYEYTQGLNTYEWTHPPLGKLIQAIPIYLTKNMSPFTYRFMGNLAGIIMLLVMYLFGKELFKKRKYAIISSLLLALDTFHFAQTRMGTVDSHLVLFIMLSIYFMIRFTNKNEIKYLLLSAIFFTCSILVKWSGIYGGLALAIIYFYNLISKKKLTWKYIGYGTLFFILMPFCVYISIYLIFPNNRVVHTNTISNVFLQQKKMYEYHSSLKEDHYFSSKWYTWPISYRPVWYYNQTYGINRRGTISSVGNIIIWWFGIIGLFYLLYDIFKRKNKNSIYLFIISMSLWLPYSLMPRIMFLYHYFPVVPFIILATVKVMFDLTKKLKKNYFIYIYLISASIFFIIYYPVISGKPITGDRINELQIFKSWYF